MQSCITITFGDCAENHVGMQKLGEKSNKGLTLEELELIQQHFTNSELVNLTINDYEPAYLLIIRNAVDLLLKDLNKTSKDLYDEQLALSWDSKAKMYGRVVDKKARHNLCYSDHAQAPDYDNGRGSVVAFDTVPLLNHIRDKLPTLLGQKGNNLVAEGNLYYDPKKCGIGFHGDAERSIVVALRLGESIPLHYQWYLKHKPVGERIKLEIHSGDIYIMSAKAVGTDWKKSSIPTLRHAAGASKFL